MNAWADLVLRHRVALAGLVVAATLALGHQAATRLRIDNSLAEYLATDDEVRVRLERFQAQFGRAEVFLVLAEGEVFTPEYLGRLRELHDAITADPGPLEEVTSLLNARHVAASAALVRVGALGDGLGDPPTAAQAAEVRGRLERPGALAGQIADARGRASAVLVRTPVGDDRASHALYHRLLELAERHDAPGFRLHVAGAPALAAAINARMLGDAYRSLGVALLLMVLLLGLVFRHLAGVVGPLLVVSLAIVWTLGTMAALGFPMTGLHNVLPTFLLAVGLGDGVHLVMAYRSGLLQEEDPQTAAREALATTGLPVMLTSLTTAASMLGFTITRLGVTTEFGAFAALGVGFAMLHSLVTLPILLGTRWAAGLRRVDPRPALVERVVRSLVDAGLLRPGRVLVGALVVAGAAGVGIASLRVSHNPLRFLPDDHPVPAAFAAADRSLGGTVNLEVEVDTGDADGLLSERVVEAFAAFEAHVRAYEQVGGVTSWLDVVRETWGALTAETDAPPLPPTGPAVAQTLLAFELGDPAPLARVMTLDQRYGRMTIRVPWLDAHEYRPLAAWVEQGAARAFGDLATAHPTGGVYTLLTIVDSLVSDMVRSFGLAVLLVFALLVALLRSLRLGLLAMVPNLLPVAVALGVMGYAGIPVDMFNLLLASVAIGVVVDDTVHFFHHVAVRRRAGDTTEDAVRHAGRVAGHALVVTSAVLALGFGAFLTATMTNLVHFGALLVVTVGVALLAELLVGPALLRVADDRKWL